MHLRCDRRPDTPSLRSLVREPFLAPAGRPAAAESRIGGPGKGFPKTGCEKGFSHQQTDSSPLKKSIRGILDPAGAVDNAVFQSRGDLINGLIGANYPKPRATPWEGSNALGRQQRPGKTATPWEGSNALGKQQRPGKAATPWATARMLTLNTAKACHPPPPSFHCHTRRDMPTRSTAKACHPPRRHATRRC